MTELETIFKKYKDKEITLEEYKQLTKDLIMVNHKKNDSKFRYIHWVYR